jgi:hypothetical protein
MEEVSGQLLKYVLLFLAHYMCLYFVRISLRCLVLWRHFCSPLKDHFVNCVANLLSFSFGNVSLIIEDCYYYC